MPIKKRLTDNPQRPNETVRGKLRHPILKTGSPHFSIWDTLVRAGIHGLTAAELKARNSYYHPQVIKDLMDCMLVAVIDKQSNEKKYIADPKGRGVIPSTVRVVVQLLEDEDGYIHVSSYVKGQRKQPRGKVRVLQERGMNFVVQGVGNGIDAPFRGDLKANEGPVVDGDYVTVITDPSQLVEVLVTK